MDRIFQISRTLEIMENNGLELKKSLGQNFLVDGNILKKIVDRAKLKKDDVVLEVGPGIGALTEEILLRGNHVSSIEIDQRFYPVLEDNFSSFENFKLFEGDATDKDLFYRASSSPKANVFIANLPYVVTTPVLENLFLIPDSIDRAIIMVQKEVANRMTASPGSKDYSSLSVFVKYFSDAKIEFTVSESSFIPRPKIKSSIVSLKIKKSNRQEAMSFMKIVHMAFNLRRKTLLNSMSQGCRDIMNKDEVRERIIGADIDPGKRAEELSNEDFMRLTESFLQTDLFNSL